MHAWAIEAVGAVFNLGLVCLWPFVQRWRETQVLHLLVFQQFFSDEKVSQHFLTKPGQQTLTKTLFT